MSLFQAYIAEPEKGLMVRVPSLRVVLTYPLPCCTASGSGEGDGVLCGERAGKEGAGSEGSGSEQDQAGGGEGFI